ncbi:hypothetical protein A33Q_1453 [Indibacter alkaliphilus LW1]|uniref:Uncharacterized protein n=1 Tax=Indibacter alkaliphilus (strain CCUG 57479 / KCTC 22604 / LW1) TaxID=1189612 RepID=S2DIE1_INDAL|nr:hypothetical protein A33Q_1453 [Indibacter alkaliphilus LW1]
MRWFFALNGRVGASAENISTKVAKHSLSASDHRLKHGGNWFGAQLTTH